MGCLPSQAAVIVALTWLCVLTASAAALGEACNTTITCENSNETCGSADVCVCKTGYFNVSGECKLDAISVVLSSPSSSVIYGSDVSLTATIKSDVPVSSVIWKKVISSGTSQNLDTTNGKYTQTGDTGSGPITLTIKNVNFTDNGTYQVYVQNTATKASTSNQVSVTVTGAAPSTVMIIVSKNPVNHNDSVTFTGSYTSVPPATEIKWQKWNGSEFVNIDTGNAGSSTEGPNPKLKINSVMFSDETSYKLYVKNSIGSTTSNEIQLNITEGGLTISTGGDVLGKVGESVTINCIITGPEPNLVWWLKYINNSNTTIVIDNTTYSGGSVDNPALTIKNLSRTDRAQYQCNAGNPRGNFSSTNKATVRVYGKFNEDCSEDPCEEEQNLECSTSTSKCICLSTHYHKNNTCYAKSGLSPIITSTASTTSQLSVSWSHPSIHYDLVTGYKVQWIGNGGSNGSKDQLDRTSDSYTESSDLIPGQLYTVTVIAHVQLTNPSQTIVVNSQSVSERLVPLQPGPIKMEESNFTHKNPKITWSVPNNTIVTLYEVTINGTSATTAMNTVTIVGEFTPGKHYTVDIVTIADNKRSSPYHGSIRIIPTKPDPPTDVRCTQELGESIEISWTAPSYPNGNISHYQINMSGKIMNTSTSATEKKFDGLIREKTYTFAVSTVNDAKDAISDPTKPISCRTKAGVADPPTELDVVDIKSRTFKITFRSPDDVKGVLAAYKIFISKGNECVQEILVNGTEECPNCTSTRNCRQDKYFPVTNISLPVEYTATGLNPYTNYLVEVMAVNGKGGGVRANATTMTEEEIPLKPEEITAKNIEANSSILSWNISDPSPGNTTYTIYVYESKDDKETSFTLKQTLKSYGFSQKSIQVSYLEEYWPYNFEVNAATVKGNRTSDTSTFRTSQAAPGKVLNLTVFKKGEDYRKAYVSWSLPPLRDHNGVLQNYVLTTNFTGKSEREELPVNLSHPYFEKSFNVTPEEAYEVKVALQNNESAESVPSTHSYSAPAGPPPRPSVDLIATEPGEHKPTDKTISLEIDYSFFKNEENGKQVFFGISVCAVPNCDGYTRKWKEDWEHLPNWHYAVKNDFPDYLVTNGTFMEGVTNGGSRKKRSIDLKLFVIGNDSTCASLEETVYCNGPLKSGTHYRVIIFACTNGGCSQFTSSGPYETIVVPVDPEGPPLGIIIGVVGAVVVVVLIIAVVIFIKRRSSSKGKPYTEKIVNPTDPEDSITKNIPRKRPIRLKELAEKVAEKHKDSNLHFAREYDDLKALCAKHSTVTSETDSNKLKNRYVNILPFDHSRVKLMLTEDDDPSTDFINANYLPGYKSPREYIATQGPIPGTIDDFWRMIWEQNVSIIVMLTLCKEEGRVKCEMYWPENTNEPKQYGDLVVETVSNSTVNFYDFRIFKIKLGDTTRSVKHFHFLQWKDFSANVQNDVMIDFIKNVRNHIRPPDMNGPVVVHCSAGVGRTGTYCALDHLFQFIDEHELDESIDIFDLVMNLREQRMCMVQTEQQYIFIHDCVKDYLEKKLKQEECLYENQAFVHDDVEEDESLYQNYNNQRTDL